VSLQDLPEHPRSFAILQARRVQRCPAPRQHLRQRRSFGTRGEPLANYRESMQLHKGHVHGQYPEATGRTRFPTLAGRAARWRCHTTTFFFLICHKDCHSQQNKKSIIFIKNGR